MGSMDGRYMTVGEVAERLGITVRSIQYYDQQGVLSPSAKGPQNQRLYTQEDVTRLYEVLCFKFAGLSLAQIRERMARGAEASPGFDRGSDLGFDTAAEAGPCPAADEASVFEDAVRETEAAFSALLRRYETLRGLARSAAAARRAGGEPDWESMAALIAGHEGEGRYFWRLSCIYDEDPTEDPAGCGERGAQGEAGQRAERDRAEHELVAAWHGVMAECVALMRSREPLDSPRSRAVARKVVDLRREDERVSGGRGFLFIESASMAHRHGNASFGEMHQEMGEYLDRLVEAYQREEREH